jgi:hypothetical protein
MVTTPINPSQVGVLRVDNLPRDLKIANLNRPNLPQH